MDGLLAPVVTGIVSVAVAFYTARWKAKKEWKRFKREVKERYASKLFEARLDTYPSLYATLSGYAKEIYYQTASMESMKVFQASLDKWNNEHGILLGQGAYHTSSRLRELLQVLREHRSDVSLEDLKQIQKGISTYEYCLRYEIGVNDIDAVGQYPHYEKRSAELAEYSSGIRLSADGMR